MNFVFLNIIWWELVYGWDLRFLFVLGIQICRFAYICFKMWHLSFCFDEMASEEMVLDNPCVKFSCFLRKANVTDIHYLTFLLWRSSLPAVSMETIILFCEPPLELEITARGEWWSTVFGFLTPLCSIKRNGKI